MNERIQQLAQEAGMYVDLNGNPWPKWMSAEECEVAYKKFAELIVQDLIHSMIKRYGDDDELPIQEIKLFVKEHFGVKE
jgi:hypothetical protein